jgi:hypothetical protein
VHEACDEVLNNKNNESEREHLANSLKLLGEAWLNMKKPSRMCRFVDLAYLLDLLGSSSN